MIIILYTTFILLLPRKGLFLIQLSIVATLIPIISQQYSRVGYTKTSYSSPSSSFEIL